MPDHHEAKPAIALHIHGKGPRRRARHPHKVVEESTIPQARYHIVGQKNQVHHQKRVRHCEQKRVEGVLKVGAAGHSRQGKEYQRCRAHYQHGCNMGENIRALEPAEQLPQEEAGGYRKP